MTHTTDAQRYTRTAAALHWLLALWLLGLFLFGLTMTGLPLSPTRLKLYNWHKWAGMAALALTIVRLAWRLGHAPPTDLPAPRWQQRAAHGAHALLYALCLAAPLAGWAYSSAAGFPVVLLGVLPLPDLVAPSRELAPLLKGLHKALVYLLAGLVLLHAAAALKHHFIDRDGLLARMLPWRTAPGRIAGLLLALAGAGLSAGWPQRALAQSAPATLVPGASEVVFTTRQMGVPVEGRFTRFSARVLLDPRQPQGGSVSLAIDTGSAQFGSAELDAELPKPVWLDARRFPQATFESSAIRVLAPGRLEVAGKLALKGSERAVVIPVALVRNGAQGTATGAFTLRRLDFKVGGGEWADTSLLADEVQVRFKLVLMGLPPP